MHAWHHTCLVPAQVIYRSEDKSRVLFYPVAYLLSQSSNMPKTKSKRRPMTTVRRSPRSSTAAGSRPMPPQLPTLDEPHQVPAGESLTNLLTLIRSQVRTEPQEQQVAGPSSLPTNASPTITPGSVPPTAATYLEPSQHPSNVTILYFSMCMSVHTYKVAIRQR